MKAFKVALTFLSLLLLSECNFDNSRRPAGSKDLVVGTVIPIGEVSPFSSRVGIGASLVELIYSPLLRLSEDGKFLPQLASEFKWDEGNSEIAIDLNADLASDVVYTFEKFKELKSEDILEAQRELAEIEIISPRKIKFKMRRFDRAFLVLLTQLPIVSRDPERSTGAFGIGAQSETEVILKRKQYSPTLVNSIVIRQMPSAKRALRELVAGNVDMLFLADEGEFGVLADLNEIAFGVLKSRMIYLLLENRHRIKSGEIPWKMIDAKLKRDELLDQLNERGLVGASNPVPKQDKWIGELGAGLQTEAEPERSFGGGKKLSLSFLGKQGKERKIARLIKRKFEEIGNQLELKEYDFQGFIGEIYKKRNFDLVLMPYSIKDTLVSNYLLFHTPSSQENFNISNYSNSEVDSFFEEARYSVDENKAKQALRSGVESLLQDPPGLFLFWLEIPIVYRKACSGFQLNSAELFSSLKDVRCEPSGQN